MMDKIKFGLIGKTLTHSFSEKYFSEKFNTNTINNCTLSTSQIKNLDYSLYELNDITGVKQLFDDQYMVGFNVTIPYKKEIIPFLTDCEEHAEQIGAVNVVGIKRDENGRIKNTVGYNTDFIGFKQSLKSWLPDDHKGIKALILGTGGASKAIMYALETMEIPYVVVSRQKINHQSAKVHPIDYDDLVLDPSIINTHHLIVNTTPLGTFPNVDEKPEIPYQYLGEQHYLYDLVYNPIETAFLKKGKSQGVQIKNGYEMLVGQAEASWHIWQNYLPKNI